MLFSSFTSAFPAVSPKSIDVVPWAPTPGQHTLLTVDDNLSPFYGAPGGKLLSVQVSTFAGVIAVNATLDVDPSASSSGTKFQVDLGLLPVGAYTINYSSTSVRQSSSILTEMSLAFTVSTLGYANAIEFFSPSLGHYFLTTNGDEIVARDKGATSGWLRTGQSFHVIPAALPLATLRPVCRFYGLPQAGLDSHFFTPSNAECVAVQKRYPGAWILETPFAFAVIPTTLNNTCPQGSIPIFRLYNNRADANHRYTTSVAVRDEMIAMGWILEGPAADRVDAATMCAGQ